MRRFPLLTICLHAPMPLPVHTREREREGERCGCTGRMRERHIQSEQSICMYIHTYVARKEKENKRHRARQCPRKGYPRPGTPGGERHPCAGIAGHNRWFLKTYGNFIRQGAPGGRRKVTAARRRRAALIQLGGACLLSRRTRSCRRRCRAQLLVSQNPRTF
jgi:hypothetical protein